MDAKSSECLSQGPIVVYIYMQISIHIFSDFVCWTCFGLEKTLRIHLPYSLNQRKEKLKTSVTKIRKSDLMSIPNNLNRWSSPRCRCLLYIIIWYYSSQNLHYFWLHFPQEFATFGVSVNHHEVWCTMMSYSHLFVALLLQTIAAIDAFLLHLLVPDMRSSPRSWLRSWRSRRQVLGTWTTGRRENIGNHFCIWLFTFQTWEFKIDFILLNSINFERFWKCDSPIRCWTSHCSMNYQLTTGG